MNEREIDAWAGMKDVPKPRWLHPIRRHRWNQERYSRVLVAVEMFKNLERRERAS